MGFGVDVENQLKMVDTVRQSSRRFIINENFYPHSLHKCQDGKLNFGFPNIYNNDMLKIYPGVLEENDKVMAIRKREEDIFQDPFKSSPSIFHDKTYYDQLSSRCNSSNDFSKSVNIIDSIDKGSQSGKAHEPTRNSTTNEKTSNYFTEFYNNISSKGKSGTKKDVPNCEKYNIEHDTASRTTMKDETLSTISSKESSDCQPNSEVSSSLREKGEFGASIDKIFPKAYKPSAVEKDIYQFWEANGYFKPKSNQSEKFSMVLPPPNVTGTLHLGHAITLAIQDALVRWYRMEGRDVVWIPGLDHAGIATQTVVEKWLKRRKDLTRHAIGREKFIREVMIWKNEKGNVIKQQLRKLGASLDWSREIFTMDQRHNEAVVEAIVRLWNAGLVYRKETLVNWSCDLWSAISDIEVDRLDVKGPTPIIVPGYNEPVMFGELFEIAFKVCDSDEEVVVATTRPETMLGDVAVAVHPSDNRYKHLYGKKVWHPLRKTAIPIIVDSAVDVSLGTGVVKITPAHSMIDWEIGQRHKLPLLSVIDGRGCISSDDYGGMFKGVKRFVARTMIRNELTKSGLLKAVLPHDMQVPICSRSGDVIEYLLKYQWFISCKKMAEKAAVALRAGLLQIEPANHENTWFTYLDNIRDWCISRQLWWGHRLPMYNAIADNKSVWVAAASEAEAISKSESLLGRKPNTVTQDPDVLDTWFSSAIYPISALGWPNQTDDFKRYYPLDLMETGHDILFFWVARMVMLGSVLTGELPFKKILLHGIVCDAMGRKMSKSLGNVVHPEDVIYGKTLENLNISIVSNHKAGLLSDNEKETALKGQQKLFPKGIPECGTDALRFTLLSHKTKSNLISFDVRECEANHNFMNKIWQSSRFSLYWAETLGVKSSGEPQNPGMVDRWILSRLSHTVNSVNAAMQSADFYLVTGAIKDFLYYTLCDHYVEAAKPILKYGTDLEAINTCQTLLYCLNVSLRMASPIIPFVTEQLYKNLPGQLGQSCMLATFPRNLEKWRDPELDATMQLGMEVLTAIRSLKSTNGFYTKHMPVEIETHKKDEITHLKSFIEVLANCSIEVTERSGMVRKQTITNTVEDHSLVHISLKNISREQHETYYQTLVKKEAKIKKALDKLAEKYKKEYFKKARKELQSLVEDQKRTLEEELRAVQAYMEVNKPE